MLNLRQLEQFALQFIALLVVQLGALGKMPASWQELYTIAIQALAAVVGVYVAATAPELLSAGTRDTLIPK